MFKFVIGTLNARVTPHSTLGDVGTNIGSRVYLMASETKYRLFKLSNQEFTFTIDMPHLVCGLNDFAILLSSSAFSATVGGTTATATSAPTGGTVPDLGHCGGQGVDWRDRLYCSVRLYGPESL
ncbi:hypothetical protein B0H11DRAFT_2339922 [Mycena galericulata]|nr:hypothetical protein B0H11DRAFT_2339922 [Mycena galericulata]